MPSCLPPEGVRAGQAGVVLLRWVSLGHISATLVDLAARGFVRVEPIPAEAPRDWLLTRQSPAKPAHPDGRLLPYEAALLHGLFAAGDQARLSELTSAFTPTLNRARAQLTRDAIRRGWLRRWHKSQRTARGDDLLEQIHAFRRKLSRLISAGGEQALGGHLPYAIAFGLSSAHTAGAGHPLQSSPGHQPALAGFASAFTTHCSTFTDWKKPPDDSSRHDGDTWSRNQWGGLPPGMRP